MDLCEFQASLDYMRASSRTVRATQEKTISYFVLFLLCMPYLVFQHVLQALSHKSSDLGPTDQRRTDVSAIFFRVPLLSVHCCVLGGVLHVCLLWPLLLGLGGCA